MLIRADNLINSIDKKHLTEVLNNNLHLEQVYQARQRLQAIWSHTTASQKELIDALQEWCHQAEASGIEALHRFAARLRTYSLKSQSV